MSKFKEQYAQLNDEQKKAVDLLEGPLLVVAGPGTGKTQLLSMRVANILQKTDSDPENILCLTFTNKAATNMRERLYELAGPETRKVVVRTFHSLAAEIMNTYSDNFWDGAKLSVAPDTVIDDIIETILSSLPIRNSLASTFGGQFTQIKDIKDALKLAKEAGLLPEELTSAIKNNLKYIDKIEPIIKKIIPDTLSYKKLPNLQKDIEKLPAQKQLNIKIIRPLDEVIKESLGQAMELDEGTNRTKNTGEWKKRWIQTVDGKKVMSKERKRNEWWLEVSRLYKNYREELHKRLYYDYSDMLVEVLQQLSTNNDMLADLQEKYQYVLIDEFQDTNAAQLRLAHLLSDNPVNSGMPNLMAVGDDDQAIFAFQGAELNNLLGFFRDYPKAQQIVLKDNYRSSELVLKKSSEIIKLAEQRLTNYTDFAKKLKAKQTFNKPSGVKHSSYPTQEHQLIGITEEIKKLWGKGERDIAVLARKHESLKRLASILQSKKIPIRYNQKNNIFEQEAARLVFLIASVAVAIKDGDRKKVDILISEVLRHPMWEISPKTLWKMAIDNYSKPDWLAYLLTNKNSNLQNFGNWFVWLSRISETHPMPLVIEFIIGLEKGEYLQSPLHSYFLKSNQKKKNIVELSAIAQVRDMAKEFGNKKSKLKDFVRFFDLNVKNNNVIANESWFVSSEKAVELLTVYKAKGLEFEHVYVIDSTEKEWQPKVNRRGSPANLRLQAYGEKDDDYVRLLYVAATRAKRQLQFSSYFADEQGKEVLPTPLLAKVEKQTIEKPKQNTLEVIESSLRWPKLDIKDEKNFLRGRLDEFELSQSALVNFLNIAEEAGPLTFKERNLLGIPHGSTIQGSFGTAIHAAISTTQRLVNESRINKNTVLDRYENALTKQNLAPSDFDKLLKTGKDLIEVILKYNKLLVPKGAQNEFNISAILGKKIQIHGNIDRLQKDLYNISISDYKTGKPLNNLDTKDKSKAVKAWKSKLQLQFYTLLVKNNAVYKGQQISTQMLYVEADPKKMSVKYNPSSEELVRLEKLINAVWRHIHNLDFPDVSSYSTDINGIINFENDLIKGKI